MNQQPPNAAISAQRVKVEEFRQALVALQSNPGFEPKSTEPLEFLKEKLQSAQDETERLQLIEEAKQSLAHAEEQLQKMEADWEDKCRRAREGMDLIIGVCDRLNEISAILVERLNEVKKTARQVSPDISAVHGTRWYDNTVSDFDLSLPVATPSTNGDRVIVRLQSGSTLERHIRQSSLN